MTETIFTYENDHKKICKKVKEHLPTSRIAQGVSKMKDNCDKSGLIISGTTGRRDDGTTGRRDDGTTGRRDDGTTGPYDNGVKCVK